MLFAIFLKIHRSEETVIQFSTMCVHFFIKNLGNKLVQCVFISSHTKFDNILSFQFIIQLLKDNSFQHYALTKKGFPTQTLPKDDD